jgi:hypothetical protein
MLHSYTVFHLLVRLCTVENLIDLLLAILSYANHGRTQEAILNAIPALQFVHDMVVRNRVALDHMNCLVEIGIECLACG